MARLRNLLSRQGREHKEIQTALMSLDMHKVPVRMEVENTSIRFNTRISVRSGAVVVAKPLNLEHELSKGGAVRFKVPDSAGRELRMEVITPHFNLTSGRPVFLCSIPTKFAHTNMRATLRFNTSRFTNVLLLLDGHAEKFRLVDLSAGGCKVYLPNQEAKERFLVNKPIEGGRINLGQKASIRLTSILPRNHRGQTVGCQFVVSEEDESRKLLQHMLASLEKSETVRYRT